MIYEIINPSDPYTFEADCSEVASVAMLLLGEGMYGCKDESGNDNYPCMFFGARNDQIDKVYLEMFGRTWKEILDEKSGEIAAALDSVLIGRASERKAFAAMLQYVPDEKKREAWYTYHEEKRSSLNDIGLRAKQLAGLIRDRKLTAQSEGG